MGTDLRLLKFTFVVSFIIVAIGHILVVTTADIEVRARNLELNAEFVVNAGNLVAFAVREDSEGDQDLNGDGDVSFDAVVHVFDERTGGTTNTGLAFSGRPAAVDGDIVAFGVGEQAQGGQDLNGDGDGGSSGDEVMHVYDAATGTTTNLGLALGGDFTLASGFLVFPVSEGAQRADLNGDGFIGGPIVHLHDTSTGTTSNTKIFAQFHVFDGVVAGMLVPEGVFGGSDLNGDDDTTDKVAHVIDPASGTITNLQIAGVVEPIAENGIFAFGAFERDQGPGGTDFNGDGDTNDEVAFVYEAATGVTTNLGATIGGTASGFRRPTRIGQGFIVSQEPEREVGDVNGDGDVFDTRAAVFVLSTGTSTNLDFAITRLAITASAVVFLVSESGQTDLNGDGDALDSVPFWHDLTTGITANLDVAVLGNFGLQSDGRFVSLAAFERFDGRDWNGDGDALDPVTLILDTATGVLGNRNLAAIPVLLANGVFFEAVFEAAQASTDLNGDGDTFDRVLFATDLLSGKVSNTLAPSPVSGQDRIAFNGGTVGLLLPEFELGDSNGDGDVSGHGVFLYDVASNTILPTGHESSSFFFSVDGNRAAFTVFERDQGNTDLNGDGDARDVVLHLAVAVPAVVPFADFVAAAEIETGADGEFEVQGAFTLGAPSDGIDPLQEDVVLNIGGFELTLPAGSLEFRRKGGLNTFQFEGEVDGIGLEFRIRELGSGAFDIRVEAEDVNLDDISNPVELILTIGNDSGEISIDAEIEGDDDDQSDKSEKSGKSGKSNKSGKGNDES